ncbi:MAG: hypothetical protein IJZ53_02035 [Tyzzerella sp.]|nr:hypothetical protein [Tyzzerella sp.]
MKQFEFQQALTQIDSRFIEEAETYQFNQRKKDVQMIKKMVAVAACVVILGIVGLECQKYIRESKEPVEDMETVQTHAFVPVEQYVAVYEQVREGNEVDLSERKGEMYVESGNIFAEAYELYDSWDAVGTFEYSENCIWYMMKNCDSKKYLICESEDNGLSLWKFESFYAREIEEMRRAFPTAVLGSYSYGDVLKLIYNVTSAEQISKIEISPSENDNTEEGKVFQKTIGTSSITDRNSIEFLYQVICEMNCNGADTELDALYSFGYRSQEIEEQIKENGHMRWVFCRNLTFVLEDGTTIDSLKYTAISGRFYEFNSINYDALDDETMEKVNGFFGLNY